jgi:hypothetical protein
MEIKEMKTFRPIYVLLVFGIGIVLGAVKFTALEFFLIVAIILCGILYMETR